MNPADLIEYFIDALMIALFLIGIGLGWNLHRLYARAQVQKKKKQVKK